jgi:hypothetical protein
MARWRREGTGTAVPVQAGVVGLVVLIMIAIWLYRSQKPAPHSPENPKATRMWKPPYPPVLSNHPELRDILQL